MGFSTYRKSKLAMRCRLDRLARGMWQGKKKMAGSGHIPFFTNVLLRVPQSQALVQAPSDSGRLSFHSHWLPLLVCNRLVSFPTHQCQLWVFIRINSKLISCHSTNAKSSTKSSWSWTIFWCQDWWWHHGIRQHGATGDSHKVATAPKHTDTHLATSHRKAIKQLTDFEPAFPFTVLMKFESISALVDCSIQWLDEWVNLTLTGVFVDVPLHQSLWYQLLRSLSSTSWQQSQAKNEQQYRTYCTVHSS